MCEHVRKAIIWTVSIFSVGLTRKQYDGCVDGEKYDAIPVIKKFAASFVTLSKYE